MYFLPYVEPIEPVITFGLTDYLLAAMTIIMMAAVLFAAGRAIRRALRGTKTKKAD